MCRPGKTLQCLNIDNKQLSLIVLHSEIVVDIENVSLPENIIPFLKEIFGDLLQMNWK